MTVFLEKIDNMNEAIRKSLGLEEDVEINEDTTLGELDKNVGYAQLLDISHEFNQGHMTLRNCFNFNQNRLTSKGIKLLKIVAEDLGETPDQYFRRLKLIGEFETVEGDYENGGKIIPLNLREFTGRDLTAISYYLDRLNRMSWIFNNGYARKAG